MKCHIEGTKKFTSYLREFDLLRFNILCVPSKLNRLNQKNNRADGTAHGLGEVYIPHLFPTFTPFTYTYEGQMKGTNFK